MTIAVTTQKGGTGKTTVATHLAVGLAKRGQRVLLLDLDPQSNSSSLLFPEYGRFEKETNPKETTIVSTILERNPLPIYQSIEARLDIVPSHILLSGADTILAIAQDHKEQRLSKQLAQVKDNYDYIFIDCPPNLGILTINAFVASDKFLVVVEPGTFAFSSIKQLQETIEYLIKKEYEHNIELLGFLFNKKAPTDVSRETYEALRNIFQERLFKTVIPRNTDIEKAQLVGSNVFDFNPEAAAAIALNHLIDEIFYHAKDENIRWFD